MNHVCFLEHLDLAVPFILTILPLIRGIKIIFIPILHYTIFLTIFFFQYCSRATLTNSQVRKEQEWFVSLLQHVAKLCTKGKGGETLTKQIFSIWEECMMDSIEDQTNITGK